MGMGHRERRGVIWLIIITLAIGGFGLWLRSRKPVDSAPTAVTVYKIETDTVYRKAKKKPGKGRNKQIRRKKGKESSKTPALRRDFLADTISCKLAE